MTSLCEFEQLPSKLSSGGWALLSRRCWLPVLHLERSHLRDSSRVVSHPEAIPVPFLVCRSLPPPFFPSVGASPRGLGSFRNLHCSQEKSGA